MTETVSVGSDDYKAYASLDQADLYANAAIHAEAWVDATEDEKGKALVTATRLLDRQAWKEDYNTVALREDVTDIVNASIEIAIALLEGDDMQNQQSSTEKVRSITAGSVSITNFRGTDLFSSRFPQIVQELLKAYLLASSDVGIIGKATGVDIETSFPIDLGLTVGD